MRFVLAVSFLILSESPCTRAERQRPTAAFVPLYHSSSRQVHQHVQRPSVQPDASNIGKSVVLFSSHDNGNYNSNNKSSSNNNNNYEGYDDASNYIGGTNGSPPSPLDGGTTTRTRIRSRISKLAKAIVGQPTQFYTKRNVSPVDSALEQVRQRSSSAATTIEEAFRPVEASLDEMEEALRTARRALETAKHQAREAMAKVEEAALEQAAVAAAVEEAAERKVRMADLFFNDIDVSSLTYDDVGYHLSEMAPPFIDEAQCLVPGEAVVRVEKAPENSRRIFAGIDIPVSVDSVWKVLTDYANLQNVVPNLTVNEVLAEYDGVPADEVVVDLSMSDEQQCEAMSKHLKGSLLRQVGGAKVVGINFSARTTLEVREWPNGLPDFAHFKDEVYSGKSRDDRALDDAKIKLKRYRFPRPFAVSSLPSRDISMQSIEDDDGEFRLYQGVWRMQPLPGCAPEGQEAMRLTYAVEVSPRAYLPVSIVEGRIAKDMCTNLVAIRDYLTKAPSI